MLKYEEYIDLAIQDGLYYDYENLNPQKNKKFKNLIISELIKKELSEIEYLLDENLGLFALQKSMSLIMKVAEEAVYWGELSKNKSKKGDYKFIAFSEKYIMPELQKSSCQFVSSLELVELSDIRRSISHRGIPFPPYLIDRLHYYGCMNQAIGVRHLYEKSTTPFLVISKPINFEVTIDKDRNSFIFNSVHIPILDSTENISIEYDYRELTYRISRGLNRAALNLMYKNGDSETAKLLTVKFINYPHYDNKKRNSSYKETTELELLTSMSRYYRNIILYSKINNLDFIVVDLFYIWIEIKIKETIKETRFSGEDIPKKALLKEPFLLDENSMKVVDRIKNNNKHYLTSIGPLFLEESKSLIENKVTRINKERGIVEKIGEIDYIQIPSDFDFYDVSNYRDDKLRSLCVQGVNIEKIAEYIIFLIGRIDKDRLPRNYIKDLEFLSNPLRTHSFFFSEENIDKLYFVELENPERYEITLGELFLSSLVITEITNEEWSTPYREYSNFAILWIDKAFSYYEELNFLHEGISVSEEGLLVDRYNKKIEKEMYLGKSYERILNNGLLSFSVNSHYFLEYERLTREEMINFLMEEYSCSRDIASKYFIP